MSPFVFSLIFVCMLSVPVLLHAASVVPPQLMLAKEFRQGLDFSDYSVSEKFDGVHAVWRQGELLTRSGRLIHAPDWFLTALPSFDIEGELWLGYGRFDEISALVRSRPQNQSLWLEVEFKVFELPNSHLIYSDRMTWLESHINSAEVSWLSVVKRHHFMHQAELEAYLSEIVQIGGEGVMLNQTAALYQPKRTDALLKYKPTWDAEAQVIGYVQGKGKFQTKMGSLKVRMADGREFRIGTGFSDEERENPPAINSWVTFAYSGLTATGKPRFARFIRLYEAL